MSSSSVTVDDASSGPMQYLQLKQTRDIFK